ncbi:hypothetical protein JW960_26410 [candidate division KSB1 bacterium]|nr:hypothetical protein [candidate division KSB1 bacterium]
MRYVMFIALLLLCHSMAWASPDASNSFRLAVPDQQQQDNSLLNYFAQQFGLDQSFENIIFIPWRQIDGTDGVLPVLILEKPDPQVNLMRQDQQQLLDDFKKRMEAIDEIQSYHEAIVQSQEELMLLKKERDAILKRLEYLKTLLENKGKTRLDRMERSNEKKSTYRRESTTN